MALSLLAQLRGRQGTRHKVKEQVEVDLQIKNLGTGIFSKSPRDHPSKSFPGVPSVQTLNWSGNPPRSTNKTGSGGSVQANRPCW